MTTDPHIPALRALGLTALEAEVYGYLAAHPPATGYRVARAIDRPTANTYKALESLHGRGAVAVEDDTRRRYRAIPPGELLRLFERRFAEDKARAAEALAGLGGSPDDHGVYRLATPEQVAARAREMIGRAREVVLARLGGEVGAGLRVVLSDAARRGVHVAVVVPRRLGIEGADELSDPSVAQEGVEMAVDRCEMQIAAFRNGELRHAIFSASPPLADSLHRMLAAEHLYVRLGQSLAEGLSIDDLEAFHARCGEVRRTR